MARNDGVGIRIVDSEKREMSRILLMMDSVLRTTIIFRSENELSSTHNLDVVWLVLVYDTRVISR